MQLFRFLQHSKNYEVRVAGFNQYLYDIDADYTLDSLFDFYGKNSYKPIGNNFQRYLEEISIYKPDLIISDLEFFTSLAAVELQIPYWIVSSHAIYFGLSPKVKKQLSLGKHYKYILLENKSFHRYHFQIENADQKFVYSYLGDFENSPDLINDFYWTRPYYVSSIKNNLESKFVAACSNTDKQLINYLKNINVDLFSTNEYENFNLNHFKINSKEYNEKIPNALAVFSTGETSIIADAFYNKKYSLIYPDYKSKECIINMGLVEMFNLGEKIYTRKSFEQINNLVDKEIFINSHINNDIKFLHQYIEEII